MIFYLFFGVVSTIVNIVTFWLCNYVLGVNYQISNVISWVFAVLCAYITNKLWVFDSRQKSRKATIGEAALFYFFRIVSLGIEMGIMYIMIDLLDLNVMLSKIVANAISIIANFFFSKLIIFK
ncbi:MAG: GtrA family protein [Bacteroidales bacterium]|nr:GtrA family protein [Bacteroidales bacterium]